MTTEHTDANPGSIPWGEPIAWETIMKHPVVQTHWARLRDAASAQLSARYEDSGQGISSSDINHTIFSAGSACLRHGPLTFLGILEMLDN